MHKILVPVDGSAIANRAVQHAIEMARRAGEAKIVLVNVQQALERWYKHGLLNEEALHHLRQLGDEQSAEARVLLSAAGALFDYEVVFGQPAEVITRVAKEQRCEAIVMGTRGLGDVENLFLGSTAYKVIQTTEMPVTLVK